MFQYLLLGSCIFMNFKFESLAAGMAGVLSHMLVYIRGEWHLQATKLFKLYVMLYGILAIVEAQIYSLSWHEALSASLQICRCYASCVFASMIMYRAVFHRLRNFPGPVLARISKLWHVYHCLDSKNHILMEKLHRQYGDFVRTGIWNVKFI